MSDELSELIDAPVERLHVEYNSWIDFADTKTRANLARHTAAIANSGGGHIVLGIDDDNRSCVWSAKRYDAEIPISMISLHGSPQRRCHPAGGKESSRQCRDERVQLGIDEQSNVMWALERINESRQGARCAQPPDHAHPAWPYPSPFGDLTPARNMCFDVLRVGMF